MRSVVVAGRSALAALACALELSSHLAVHLSGQLVGLLSGGVQVGTTLAGRQPAHRRLRALRILRRSRPLEFLDRARELGVLTLERGLGRLLHSTADERHLEQQLHDWPDVFPAGDAPEE